MEWNDFENIIKDLLKSDNAKLTSGSGSTKHEEDVIGENTISQCKYTQNKNLSILSEDMDRLLLSTELHHKFPLFFNSSNNNVYLTIPINNNTKDTINNILELIIIDQLNQKIYNNFLVCNDIKTFKVISKQVKHLFYKIDNLKNHFSSIYNKIRDKYEIIQNKLINYNLFENL